MEIPHSGTKIKIWKIQTNLSSFNPLCNRTMPSKAEWQGCQHKHIHLNLNPRSDPILTEFIEYSNGL